MAFFADSPPLPHAQIPILLPLLILRGSTEPKEQILDGLLSMVR